MYVYVEFCLRHLSHPFLMAFEYTKMCSNIKILLIWSNYCETVVLDVTFIAIYLQRGLSSRSFLLFLFNVNLMESL